MRGDGKKGRREGGKSYEMRRSIPKLYLGKVGR